MKQSRRKFIELSAAGSAALFLSKMEAFAIKPQHNPNKINAANLKIMQSNWGFDGSLDAFCAKAKKSGYDGVELWWPAGAKAQQAIFTALDKYDLEIGFACSGWQKNAEEHLTHF